MDAELEQSSEDLGAASAAAGMPDGASAAPRAIARLVEYHRGRHIALPPHTTYALIEGPEPVAVPGAAACAYGLIVWQGMRLPLIDLAVLLHPGAGPTLDGLPRYALIVAYQRVPRGPLEYGAIGMHELPQTIAVADDAQCDLPADSALWPVLAQSCFQHEGRAVPVLDTTRLFAAAHR